jgi:CRISPR-associated protein Cmr2
VTHRFPDGGKELTESPKYTAISFAPVQGFIEKSRKLRDLYGASQILSYLSQQLAQFAERLPGLEVISPALIRVQDGMPNRILIKGLFERNDVQNTLIQAWDRILTICKDWVEENVPASDRYHWDAEWIRWKQCTWEIFWGTGETSEAAMLDLERRKLKRDWTGINWIGESSSLTGTDAIAWHHLGAVRDPKHPLTDSEKKELTYFYRQLAWVLDDPYQRSGKIVPVNAEVEGKYIAANERLSIPELVKRLVTLPKLAKQIGMTELGEGFKDIVREPGHWTGWFMGDGDEVGNHLKKMTGDAENQKFSEAMRRWGKKFKDEFPDRLGRVVYAGGDDFLGVLYSDRKESPVLAKSAFEWLREFPTEWQKHQQPINVSVGFVWAGNRVPQRDILQHCREAEKRSKNLGRDRVTIRVVFNSGQYVQWTCPWDYLHVLQNYRDRDGNTWSNKYLNWTHIYNDWEHLKARHAIAVKDKENVDERIALELFDLYFGDRSPRTDELRPVSRAYFSEGENCKYITGEAYTAKAIIEWIDGLVKVGWQLCSNT